MNEKFKHFVRFGHIPVLIILQIIFIILFAIFVVYDPVTVTSHKSGTYQAGDNKGQPFGNSNTEGAGAYVGYPCKFVIYEPIHLVKVSLSVSLNEEPIIEHLCYDTTPPP